ETNRAEMLRRWLLDSWPHQDVTPSEILNRGPNSIRERVKLSKLLVQLVQNGWLMPLQEGEVIRGAARKEAYRIVRAGHVV
ncbi:hypothetical protein DIE28_12595, partial [Paracoccus thiocyanatus]